MYVCVYLYAIIQEEIQSIFLNCDMSNARTKAGLEQIVQAEHLQRTGQCVVS